MRALRLKLIAVLTAFAVLFQEKCCRSDAVLLSHDEPRRRDVLLPRRHE